MIGIVDNEFGDKIVLGELIESVNAKDIPIGVVETFIVVSFKL